jgi:hypothetical protein
MSEVLVLSPVGRIHPSLNLGIPNMSLLQNQLDCISQVLSMHPIGLRLTQSMKQVVDRLIVGVERVPRSWGKEVHQLDIACVHRDIPKDLTLSMEKRCHPLTPHLVVLAIEVSPLWLLIDFLLYNLDHDLVRSLCLTISLGLIRRRIKQFDSHSFGKLPELQGYKLCSFISCNCLRNSKPVDDVFFNKLTHVF